MLPKKHRLVNTQDFSRIKTKGRRYQTDFYGLLVYARGDSAPSRFGFIVSKKISQKAVVRNKIKRLLRNLISGLVNKLRPGYDILFLAKSTMLQADMELVESKTKKLFTEALLI
jgi:ribonuclease P protein component